MCFKAYRFPDTNASFFFQIYCCIYHVKIFVFVQIVDLKQVLRLETVILAAFEKHFQILPL